MTFRKKRGSLLLVLALLLGMAVPAAAALSSKALNDAVTDTAAYMYAAVKSPQVGSIGGEWAVLGLARSGYAVPESYYQTYYCAVEDYVAACGGVLHDRKYTEYSRVILALSAIGRDARDVAGYDLTVPLGDYDKTIWQGLNGPIWALIALDSRNYPMPENPEAATQATRQMYVDRILECQLPDGGWSLFGGTAAAAGDAVSDPDITGMALQALAKYREQSAVAAAIEKALVCMSSMQNGDGGFGSGDIANAESCVQMIVALCELGIPLDDGRFVKNGHTMLDALMTYYVAGGGFLHTLDGAGSNQMASEQGLYGLVAAQRAAEGRSSLYRMEDAITITDGDDGAAVGLPGKHSSVKAMPIIAPGKTFDDVSGVNAHPNQTAIEALAARGIVNGRSDTIFAPDEAMTRAEFAAIVVRALGLDTARYSTAETAFSDVAAGAWYYGAVCCAAGYGIVNGVGDGRFAPGGTITRQEAAVMVARAAALCGMDTGMDAAAVRDTLSPFGDYVRIAQWAREGVAFCYDSGIWDNSGLDIQPAAAIRRCEIAQTLFGLLGRAGLL